MKINEQKEIKRRLAPAYAAIEQQMLAWGFKPEGEGQKFWNHIVINTDMALQCLHMTNRASGVKTPQEYAALPQKHFTFTADDVATMEAAHKETGTPCAQAEKLNAFAQTHGYETHKALEAAIYEELYRLGCATVMEAQAIAPQR